MNEVKTRAMSAVRWTTFVTSARVVLQSLQLFVLARLLTSQDFGMMAMVLTVTAFVQLFADLGVSSVIIHARQISDEVLSTLYWLNLSMGAALSLMIAAASPALAAMLGDPRVAAPLALAGCSFFALALGQQLKVLAEKRLEFRTVAIVELASAIISTTLAITSAFMGAGVYSLVIGILSLSLGNSIFYWIFARSDWRLGFHFRFSEAKPYLVSGMHLLGTSLANTASLQIDVFIVGRMLGSTLLGFYSVPRELCLKVMMATNPIVTRVGTPLMAEVQNDKARIQRVYLMTVAMTSAINWPVYGFIAAFRHDVITIALGERWAPSADLLAVFAAWGMFRSISNPVGSLLYGTGHSRLALAQSLAVTVTLAITVAIAAKYGTMTAAVALAAYYLLFIFALWVWVLRPITGAPFLLFNRQWVVPGIVTAASAAIALGIAEPIHAAIPRLVVGLLTGGLCYMGLSWVINRDWVHSMMALAGRRGATA